MLLEVSTSDESCLRVCVRLRDASASARVSSTGRVSHVSQPMQPLIPQPAEAAAVVATDGDGADDEGVGGTVVGVLSVLG